MRRINSEFTYAVGIAKNSELIAVTNKKEELG